MGGTFFRKIDLEEKIADPKIADPTYTTEDYVNEILVDIQDEIIESPVGRAGNNLYEKLNMEEYFGLFDIDIYDLYDKIENAGHYLFDLINFEEFIEYGVAPSAAIGAFTAGSLLYYVTNLK